MFSNADYKTRKAFLAYPNGILDEDYATVKYDWLIDNLVDWLIYEIFLTFLID